jgi:hypothetical protein
MAGRFKDDEKESVWKEPVVASSKHHPGILQRGTKLDNGQIRGDVQATRSSTEQKYRFIGNQTCSVPKTLLSVTFLFFPVTSFQRLKYVHVVNTVNEYVLLKS